MGRNIAKRASGRSGRFPVLHEPGPFLAFTNGDAGANNYLVDGTDGRFIDFEFAGFRHASVRRAVSVRPGLDVDDGR